MEPHHPIESQAAPSDRVTRHAHDKACRHHPIESQAPTNRSLSHHCSVSDSEEHAGGGCLGDDVTRRSGETARRKNPPPTARAINTHTPSINTHTPPHTQSTMLNHMVT